MAVATTGPGVPLLFYREGAVDDPHSSKVPKIAMHIAHAAEGVKTAVQGEVLLPQGAAAATTVAVLAAVTVAAAPRLSVVGRGRPPAGAPRAAGVAAAVQVGQRGRVAVDTRVGTAPPARAGPPGAQAGAAPVPRPLKADALVVVGTGEGARQRGSLLLLLPTLAAQVARPADGVVRRRVDEEAIRVG